nr:MAG TPA: hypothetical protein [Bacteriophage sp.]
MKTTPFSNLPSFFLHLISYLLSFTCLTYHLLISHCKDKIIL